MTGTLTTSIAGINFRLPTRSNSFHRFPINAVQTAKPVTAMNQESLYQVLRIEKNATLTEIKTAYRSLAKIYHPDASDFKQDDGRDFIEIHDAYATLSDPVARELYDLKSSSGFRRKSGVYKAAGKRPEVYTCRRWETDQCW